MCTWYRHWANRISGIRHIHPAQLNSECLHMLGGGEGDALRTDSFWHDPESKKRGTTKPNCFFLVTEFRLTHCEASEYMVTLLYFLMNTQHSSGWKEEEREAAPSWAAGMVRSKG